MINKIFLLKFFSNSRIYDYLNQQVKNENNSSIQQFPGEMMYILNILILSDRVSYDLSEVPSIFLEPHFDLSKHDTFYTVFSNIFLKLDTHSNVPTANIKISDKSVQEKVIGSYL